MDSQFDPDPRYRILEAGETITTECEYHSGTTGWIKVTDRDIIRSTRFDPTQARPCRIKINDHAPIKPAKPPAPVLCDQCQREAEDPDALICRPCESQDGGITQSNFAAKPAQPAQADSHYREIEARSGIEPITIMEEINKREAIPTDARLAIAMAQKHIMRAGCKAGEDWAKEIAKAKNYLHRALNGAWE